jgi:serine/threonine protein kinase
VVLKKLMLKGDSAHRERFRREATLMMNLRHENVVGVYDHFKEGSAFYLVMEFVDGRPLSELLAREGALPPGEAAWLGIQIATALAHIHSQGIVHRDLKPSNVLLGRDGTVKLGDFGIAFTPGGDDDITSEGTALGTPTFMAPEQLEDARLADERSDMWSFGVCLFELLTGRKFVTGPSPAAIREALPEAVRNMTHRIPPKLPINLRHLLRKTLRMKPDSRLRNGQAAVRVLGRSLRTRKAPDSLQNRLDALLASMEPASDPTPKAQNVERKAEDSKPGGLGDLRSLFVSSRPRKSTDRRGRLPRSESGRNESPKIFSLFKSRPLVALIVAVILFCLSALLIIPGAWDAVLRRNTHGMFSLRLNFPEGAPDYWLTGAEARVFREGDDTLYEIASPLLRTSSERTSMQSRRITLPAGAYRLSWSLGDKVTWHSFQLRSFNENHRAGEAALVLVETLGDPPSFPLDLQWSAENVLNGDDISSRTRIIWDRIDRPGESLVSGGRYRLVFNADGFLSSTFTVAVSPWRRYLGIQAALWPLPALIQIRNVSGRSVMPRLDDSGRYLDMQAAPRIERIGRLKTGATLELVLIPGPYSLTPGMGQSARQDLFLDSGEEMIIFVESDANEGLVMRVSDQ